jgi:hypothetical protein
MIIIIYQNYTYKKKYQTGILEESIETLQNEYYDSKEFIKSDIRVI